LAFYDETSEAETRYVMESASKLIMERGTARRRKRVASIAQRLPTAPAPSRRGVFQEWTKPAPDIHAPPSLPVLLSTGM